MARCSSLARHHYDLMPHKPAMLCQNAHQQLFQILQMLQNYLVLPSQRRRSLEGKGGQIFEEGTRFQVLRKKEHRCLPTNSCHHWRNGVCCDRHSCHARLSVIKFESECYLLVNVAWAPRALIWPEVSVSLTTT